MPGSTTALVIFTSSPRAESKRFGLGRAGDRRLRRLLVEHALRTAQAPAPDVPILVASDEPFRDPGLPRGAANPASPRFILQRGSGFEARFLGVLERVAAMGFERILVVGSDTPQLGVTDLRRGLDAESGETVVGPSLDGGFYLLSISSRHLGLLRGLPWRRPGLCRELLRRLKETGVGTSLLPPRRDLDGAADLRPLRSWLDRLCLRILGRDLGRAPSRAKARPPSRAPAPRWRDLLAVPCFRGPPLFPFPQAL